MESNQADLSYQTLGTNYRAEIRLPFYIAAPKKIFVEKSLIHSNHYKTNGKGDTHSS